MSNGTIHKATRRNATSSTSRAASSSNSRPDAYTGTIRSDKIRDEHLQRLAIVYVRQSTQQQVLEHRESTARQYALADRAVALGWPRAAVEVIDEDQGHSGSSAEGRSGFQRLLSEISSDRVGLILGLEMSRLARSCKDWHALLELCAIYRTLLADADGLYDPSNYNDRLLLGLKGTMSESGNLHTFSKAVCNRECGTRLSAAKCSTMRPSVTSVRRVVTSSSIPMSKCKPLCV